MRLGVLLDMNETPRQIVCFYCEEGEPVMRTVYVKRRHRFIFWATSWVGRLPGRWFGRH